MLGNADPGCSIHGLNFNLHDRAHLIRAGQEGIAFAFHYGMEIMKNTGIDPSVIRAGNANMFLSPVFRDTLAGITGATIELYNTDGAAGCSPRSGDRLQDIHIQPQKHSEILKKSELWNPISARKMNTMQAYKNWLNYFES